MMQGVRRLMIKSHPGTLGVASQLVLMKQLLQKPLRYKAVAQKTCSSP